jgi:hypothetical protein
LFCYLSNLTIYARVKIDTAAMCSAMITIIVLQSEKLNVRLSRASVQLISSLPVNTSFSGSILKAIFFSLCKFLQQLQNTDGIGPVRTVDFESSKVVGGNTKIKVFVMWLVIRGLVG